MTISTSASSATFLGNGTQTVFAFGFVWGNQGYLSVTTVIGGVATVVPASQYTLSLNAAVPGQIWGVGGSVTYPLIGSPLATGSSLTIARTVPDLQTVSLSNQGSQTPQSTEQGLDLLEMQIQQTQTEANYAFSAPITDSTPPVPVPAASVRANQNAVFDGSGNLTAGTALASGTVSTAMQPVVNAATLALGRTAFGLGALAVENFGSGLGDDGSGNARVNQTVVSDSTNQSVTAAFAWTLRAATVTNLIYTLPLGSTLWNGFTFQVSALAGPVTLSAHTGDVFYGLSGGVSYTIPLGSYATISCNAATNATWYVRIQPSTSTNLNAAYGQCTFIATSATVVAALPTGGNLITIAGGNYAIPSGGVSSTITNCSINGVSGQALSAATLYYAYLFLSGGTLTIDFSTTGHTTDGTAGNVGVEIKSGDNSRTLVGMVYPLAGPVFSYGNVSNFYVTTWFNRGDRSVIGWFTTARSSTSTSYAEINSEIRVGFLLWVGNVPTVSMSGAAFNTTSGSTISTAVGLSNSTVLDISASFVAAANNQSAPISAAGTPPSLGEGRYYVTLLGLVSANTGTWAGGSSPGSRCALSVQIFG